MKLSFFLKEECLVKIVKKCFFKKVECLANTSQNCDLRYKLPKETIYKIEFFSYMWFHLSINNNF